MAASFYFVQARQIQELKKHNTSEVKPTGTSNFRIAYFDMDSLEAHYDYFKDAQATTFRQMFGHFPDSARNGREPVAGEQTVAVELIKPFRTRARERVRSGVGAPG